MEPEEQIEDEILALLRAMSHVDHDGPVPFPGRVDQLTVEIRRQVCWYCVGRASSVAVAEGKPAATRLEALLSLYPLVLDAARAQHMRLGEAIARATDPNDTTSDDGHVVEVTS